MADQLNESTCSALGCVTPEAANAQGSTKLIAGVVLGGFAGFVVGWIVCAMGRPAGSRSRQFR